MSDVVTTRSRGQRDDSSTDRRTVRTSEGRTIAYAEYGSQAGTPVLFLHGMPGSRVLGALFDEVAREAGVRLLAPDRPGYGRSDAWPGRTLSDTAEWISPVLDDASVSSVGVVGFSGGGPFALALAATRPEVVDGVDLVSGASPPSLTENTPLTARFLEFGSRSAPRVMKALIRGQAWLATMTSPALVVSQYTSNDGWEAVPEAAAEIVRRDFIEAVSNDGQGLVTESRLLAGDWDFVLGEIDESVRLWHGTADENVPIAGVRRLATELPNGQLTEMEGVDHLNALLRCRGEILERYGHPEQNDGRSD